MAGTRYSRGDWYQTPLYYDIVFNQDTATEADFLEAMLERHGRSRSRPWRILEPACGSGRLVAELARRGHQISGFDASQAMIDFARRRLNNHSGAASTLTVERMESFRVRGRFDLVHCLLSTFKYLLTEQEAESHLRRAARALKPGGIYVLGLHLTDYSRGIPSHERWVGRSGATEVICNTRTWPADSRKRLENLRTRLRVRNGRSREILQETCWQCRTYNARQLKRLLAKTPELERVTQYGFSYDLESERDLDDSQEDIVLVLRRNRD